jgi:hypothetical protein
MMIVSRMIKDRFHDRLVEIIWEGHKHKSEVIEHTGILRSLREKESFLVNIPLGYVH